MLPSRKTTGLPEAFACAGVVTRGLAKIMTGAALRSGLRNIVSTCRNSVLSLRAAIHSWSCSVDMVRVQRVRSGTVSRSAGHLPVQPAGTSSPQ